MKLKDKLERVIELKKKIEDVAKPIYKECHELEAEVIKEVLERKSDQIQGILFTPFQFRCGGTLYEIKPEYMSAEGQFKNAVWKYLAPEMFSLRKVIK